ncbi:MAG: phytoene/squalene synthase family protein [Comamonadaceae bacterium]|nr:MAG: phytoene/squalene synthase family protein [Comamonadaceae bacterium]
MTGNAHPARDTLAPAARAAAAAHARTAIRKGSSSFAAASRLFDSDTRDSALMLYAWCRHCDDVIDGQVDGHLPAGATDATATEQRLERLQCATRLAWQGLPPDEPAFICLSEVVARHDIPLALLMEHLEGFGMDVRGERYRTLSDTLLYCYRVAGVVGLMMARIMGSRDPDTLNRACDLGLGFQLTNIARDLVEDAAVGRVYMPQQWLDDAGIAYGDVGDLRHRVALAELARRLVDTAECYYDSSVTGIADLPLRSAWSVATARDVYRAIGRMVKARGAHAWDHRVSTSTAQKLWFAARGAGVAVAARAAHTLEPERLQ